MKFIVWEIMKSSNHGYIPDQKKEEQTDIIEVQVSGNQVCYKQGKSSTNICFDLEEKEYIQILNG